MQQQQELKLYKDDSKLQREKGLKYLADSLGDLEKALLDGHELSEFYSYKEHKPYREKCTRSDKDDSKSDNDEERIFRCLYYRSNYKCPNDKCSYGIKYVIDKGCGFVVQDYQVPRDKKVPGVGKIDLVLKNIKDNKLYAVEVKRDDGDNKENILRMIAEILTYTTVTPRYHYEDPKKYNEKGPEMIPAIGFFKGFFKDTPQYKDYKDLRKDENENQNLKKIIDSTELKIFLFTDLGGDESGIHKLDIKMLNPDTK